MGGHAFRDLNCPRISPEIYAKVKSHATIALRAVFAHVVVPTEMPDKNDYGDVDILAATPFHSPSSTSNENFDWDGTVDQIRRVLDTTHGFKGSKSFGCMFFAIRAPDHEEEDFWVQVDVKVCFDPGFFEWQTYELSYATISKMKGSMVKPLGLTIDPEGLHIRVEGMDETNFPGSMVWISKDPKDVLRVMGLDRRILDTAFKTKEEIYKYFVSSWLFNPAHFGARLAQDGYSDYLDDRSPHWVPFIKEWIPNWFPDYRFVEDAASSANGSVYPDQELKDWNKHNRAAVREKVFTMFPHIAQAYYTKRAAYVKELEEQRLKALIMNAIPKGEVGWKVDLSRPRIIIKQPEAGIKASKFELVLSGQLTPPINPGDKVFDPEMAISNLVSPSSSSPTQSVAPWDVTLCLEALPREPPYTWKYSPPPTNMGEDKKVLCVARWTVFDPDSGQPYLMSSSRDKDIEMHWTDATYAGATDQILVDWVEKMWWHIWMRQSHTNYVGMWKHKFAGDDQKAEKKKVEGERREDVKTKVKEMAMSSRDQIVARLRVLNNDLGLV